MWRPHTVLDCQLLPQMNTDPRPGLVAASRCFYGHGWMLGTAGNLSARLPDGSFWITVSGRAKGELQPDDFIRIAQDGEVLDRHQPGDKPSAETSIHQAIYGCFPEAEACYHVHSIEANLVSRLATKEDLPLPGIEMLKGLGVWEENPKVTMPVFDNHLYVPRIAAEICQRFQVSPPQVPALLIRDHGITVWAPSQAAARHYVELVEYIFRYMVSARQVGFCDIL
jgi:methylthioribulose-1-phosphate dehydratase